MLKKIFIFLFITSFFLSNLQAMEPENKEVQPLANIVLHYIVKEIKKQAKELTGKNISEITDAVTSKWLNAGILNSDSIELIKSTMKMVSINLCENEIRAFAVQQLAISLKDYESIVCLLPLDNDHVIAGSDYGSLCIWNHKTNTLIITKPGHGRIKDLALLPTGNFSYASNFYGLGTINSSTGKCLGEFERLIGHINCLAIAQADKLVSGSSDRSIRIWDINTQKCLNVLNGHKHSVECLIIKKDKIISGSMDSTIKIWDLATGKLLNTLDGHTEMIQHIKDLSLENTIISAALDETLRIWDIETGECLKILVNSNKKQRSFIYDLLVLPNNIIAVTFETRIYIWNSITGERLHKLKGHDHSVYKLAALSDDIITSCSPDGTIRIWDIVSGNCLNIINTKEYIWRITVNSDGLILAGGSGGSLYAYRPGITFEETLLYLSKNEVIEEHENTDIDKNDDISNTQENCLLQ